MLIFLRHIYQPARIYLRILCNIKHVKYPVCHEQNYTHSIRIPLNKHLITIVIDLLFRLLLGQHVQDRRLFPGWQVLFHLHFPVLYLRIFATVTAQARPLKQHLRDRFLTSLLGSALIITSNSAIKHELTLPQSVNLFLDSSLSYESNDLHRACLAHSVSAILSLSIILWIEAAIKDDNFVSIH